MRQGQLIRSLGVALNITGLIFTLVLGSESSVEAAVPATVGLPVCPRGGPPGSARCHLALSNTHAHASPTPDTTALSPETLMAVYNFPLPPLPVPVFGSSSLAGSADDRNRR